MGVAKADLSRPRWMVMQHHYAELFSSIPASRLLTPDAQVWIDAGVVAGTLARTRHSHLRKVVIL